MLIDYEPFWDHLANQNPLDAYWFVKKNEGMVGDPMRESELVELYMLLREEGLTNECGELIKLANKSNPDLASLLSLNHLILGIGEEMKRAEEED